MIFVEDKKKYLVTNFCSKAYTGTLSAISLLNGYF